MENEIIINYISNNCYSIDVLDYFLVINYSQGILEIPNNKNVIFIATSNDPSYYTSEILKINHMSSFMYLLNHSISKIRTDDNIIYLKDKNLEMDTIKNLYKLENISFLDADKEYEITEELFIRTSLNENNNLDIIINVYGIEIFYGGGFALTNSSDFNLNLLDIFEEESIDIAFFPIKDSVDKQLFSRAEKFMDLSYPQIFLPLNINDDFKSVKNFRRKYLSDDIDVRLIYENNQKLFINMDFE